MSAGDKLPPKRKLFAELYVKNGFNGTKAYQAAGYKGDERTAAPEASRLTRNPKVKDWIDEILQTASGDKLTPEFARAATLDYLKAAKGKGDMNAWGRGVEMANRATGTYSQTVNVQDMSTEALLKSLKGAMDEGELVDLALEHGLDPESLGLRGH